MKENKNATVNNQTTEEVKKEEKEVKETTPENNAPKEEQAQAEKPEANKDLPAEVKPEEEKEGFFAKCKRIAKEKIAPKAKKIAIGVGLLAGGYALAKLNQRVTDRKLADLAEQEDSSGSYEPEDEGDLEIDEIQDEET